MVDFKFKTIERYDDLKPYHKKKVTEEQYAFGYRVEVGPLNTWCVTPPKDDKGNYKFLRNS